MTRAAPTLGPRCRPCAGRTCADLGAAAARALLKVAVAEQGLQAGGCQLAPHMAQSACASALEEPLPYQDAHSPALDGAAWTGPALLAVGGEDVARRGSSSTGTQLAGAPCHHRAWQHASTHVPLRAAGGWPAASVSHVCRLVMLSATHRQHSHQRRHRRAREPGRRVADAQRLTAWHPGAAGPLGTSSVRRQLCPIGDRAAGASFVISEHTVYAVITAVVPALVPRTHAGPPAHRWVRGMRAGDEHPGQVRHCSGGRLQRRAAPAAARAPARPGMRSACQRGAPGARRSML